MFTRLKNRIRNFPRPLLIVIGVFLVMGAVAAFAEKKLTENQKTWSKSTYNTPAEYDYDGLPRKYAYMTWAKFGYKIKLGGGAEAVRTIDTMYVPSFDHKFDNPADYYDTGQAAVPADEVSKTLKDSYFDPLNWPFVGGGRYYDLSDRPGGWKDEVGSKAWNRAADMYKLEVNVTRTKGDGYTADHEPLSDKATPADPQRVKAGDGSSSRPADVGWRDRDNKFVYKKSAGPITYTDMDGNTTSTPGEVGWWGLTDWAGVMLVSPLNKTGGYGDVVVAQNYNVMLADLKRTYMAKTPGEKDRFTVSLWNEMPFDARDVHLRAYIQEKGKEPMLLDFYPTLSKLRGYGRGWDTEGPQAIYVTNEFEVPVPVGPPGGEAPEYEVIATANIYHQGGWVNQNLVSDWRNSGGKKIFGGNGAPETNYADNVQKMALMGFSKDKEREDNPDPPSPPEPPKTDNLACTDLQVFDENGNSVTQVVQGKNYTAKAVFTSTFDFEGDVKMRLYEKNDYGWHVKAGDDVWYVMPAKGTKTMEWGWSPGSSDQVTLTASIAYKSGDGASWDRELFEDEEESTYDDNKRYMAVGVDDMPPYQPLNLDISWPLYYWPVKTVRTPVYEEREIEEKVEYYIPVPIEKAPPVKKRLRLVPNQN
ncbi:MAG: hypothetical protein C4542_05500 [Dehalococcoidia bacterium]|nr:MAG: hypothetical protein C4542_05500 [Dehalococcoidia bacterium]